MPQEAPLAYSLGDCSTMVVASSELVGNIAPMGAAVYSSTRTGLQVFCSENATERCGSASVGVIKRAQLFHLKWSTFGSQCGRGAVNSLDRYPGPESRLCKGSAELLDVLLPRGRRLLVTFLATFLKTACHTKCGLHAKEHEPLAGTRSHTGSPFKTADRAFPASGASTRRAATIGRATS